MSAQRAGSLTHTGMWSRKLLLHVCLDWEMVREDSTLGEVAGVGEWLYTVPRALSTSPSAGREGNRGCGRGDRCVWGGGGKI